MLAACLLGAVLAPSCALAAKAASVLSADTVNSATWSAATKPSAALLLRAQVLLDRARFSPGEIDAAGGSNTRRALAGYQRKLGLEATGELDGPTWRAMVSDKAEALTTYTVSEADVAGPFLSIPDDMAAKARLPALGFSSPAEALGEKFHASPALLKRLNPGKDLARAGEQILVPNVLDLAPLPKAGWIVIDRSERTLTLFNTEGKPVAQFPVSSGTDKDPLPIGSWKVNGSSTFPVFHYNPSLFWDAAPGERKATIPAGPNNPVGAAWIDLSKPHYGIHGTPLPSTIGKTQSHGCIRLTNWDVLALNTSVAAGTDVLMQE